MRSMEAVIVGATDCTGLTVAMGLFGVNDWTLLTDGGAFGCLGGAKKLVIDCWAFGLLAFDIVALVDVDVDSHVNSEI